MYLNKKIYIAGHSGMVGSAVTRRFQANGYNNLIVRELEELDLTNQAAVDKFFEKEKPEIVILAAGRVGGIGANKKYPADFIYQNIMIWSNVINAAAVNNVEKLIFLGSATVYPKDAKVPFKEEYLLTGPLDKNTEPYAIAKISAIKLCESLYRERGLNFLSLTLANLYGPYDHFESEDSHVVPALISKIFKAKNEGLKEVELWGTGKPTRDLLFVEDLADAIEFALNNIEAKMIFEQGISHINIGTGIENTIKNIALNITRALEFEGEIKFDITKPDGPLRKSVDTTRINNFGWSAKTNLKTGLQKTCDYYLSIKK